MKKINKKNQILQKVLNCELTVAKASKKYKTSRQTIYNWINEIDLTNYPYKKQEKIVIADDIIDKLITKQMTMHQATIATGYSYNQIRDHLHEARKRRKKEYLQLFT